LTAGRAGWVAGAVLGWLIYQVLVALIRRGSDIALPPVFPAVTLLLTLAGVIFLTVMVIRGPLRRAVRIQPGTALRYQ
jgi:ABC-type antimicrobial peptide transport system permease subunit